MCMFDLSYPRTRFHPPVSPNLISPFSPFKSVYVRDLYSFPQLSTPAPGIVLMYSPHNKGT